MPLSNAIIYLILTENLTAIIKTYSKVNQQFHDPVPDLSVQSVFVLSGTGEQRMKLNHHCKLIGKDFDTKQRIKNTGFLLDGGG